MIKLLQNPSSLKLRRKSVGGYPLLSIAEAKMADYTVGYGFMRQANITSNASPPEMANLYPRDTQAWNMIWPGSYDWNDQQQEINYIQDASFHSHGYGSYVPQSMQLLSQMYRNYALPSGISNPPVAARMWLQSCGQAIYHSRPENPSTSGMWPGVVGTNWSSGYYGLELHFWSQTGTGTATYVLTHSNLASYNSTAGNTLQLRNGCWPTWSGAIMSGNLPNVCPLFAQGNGVVCCRLRWVFPSTEGISPICDFCSNGGLYSAPATRIKYASNPMLYVWG